MGECRFSSVQGDDHYCGKHESSAALCTQTAADLEQRFDLEVNQQVEQVTRDLESRLALAHTALHEQTEHSLELTSHIATLEREQAEAKYDVRNATEQRDIMERDLAQAEATVERMREELTEELDTHRAQRNYGEWPYCRCGIYLDDDGECPRLKALEAALSPDAGRALAAEVEALREVANYVADKHCSTCELEGCPLCELVEATEVPEAKT